MRTAKRLKGIGEYYFSQKLREIDEMRKSGHDIINLGIGSPDLPPHPDVISVLAAESSKPNTHAYQGYKGSPLLRQAIADWYEEWYHVQLNPDTEILPLIGSKEGIMHVCMTYIDKGDRVLVPNPGYPTYRSAVTLAGGVCLEYDLKEKNSYKPNFRKLSKKKAGRVRMMFVNYPQMPTGQLPTAGLFEDIISFARDNGILVVHDNPYSFILNENPMSMLSVDGAKDHVIELNSLSKSHNMAGWRVGMLCGAADRVNDVLRFKSNMDSGMFLPVQLAAVKALTLGKEWFEQVNNTYRERRQVVFNLLDALGCRYSKEQAGLFVWAHVPPGYKDGFAMSDAVLQQAHVFITPGGIFGNAGRKYIRVSLCAPVHKFMEAGHRITEKQVN